MNSEPLKQPRTGAVFIPFPGSPAVASPAGSDAITTHQAIKSGRSNGRAAQPPACIWICPTDRSVVYGILRILVSDTGHRRTGLRSCGSRYQLILTCRRRGGTTGGTSNASVSQSQASLATSIASTHGRKKKLKEANAIGHRR